MVKSIPYSSKNSSTPVELCSVSVRFTAKITASSSSSLYFCISGISALQGPHHVAQKFNNTFWPRKSDNLTSSPSIVSNLKSGARSPRSNPASSSCVASSAISSSLSTKSYTAQPNNPITTSTMIHFFIVFLRNN